MYTSMHQNKKYNFSFMCAIKAWLTSHLIFTLYQVTNCHTFFDPLVPLERGVGPTLWTSSKPDAGQ